tara:strand:- start:20678 stop:20929 length:252 start_codon:yes stop_codon:yes gene_type:complete
MIIPVRCFTCGKVLGDKWNYYQTKCEEKKIKMKDENKQDDNTDMNDLAFYEKWGYGTILDDLGLKRLCCRRHMLGNVELINII